ncbi:DUF1056 family protein [Fructilactobacillus lindneri]|uniref:DUF1056 family protein n=2 Tax=Fructilactobacillus lindneri TaxID=53444 RepID=A0AB33BF98_9LACO|nr:DUF1056 family protein [Fructilactobacillus lindneri]ANZ59337.1 hypothetical protein AYR59_04620 [Fructilactobacillus lindneri]POH04589.1 hypothetical protein BGL33_06775 [Fructilactobacillus lindneri]POH06182.1 hypothetical protein BGL35_07400 [Fructilactobacillus lindneri]POH08568.1 hypothetical protein BGL36_00030 [Fructilactobacillus lindneri]POH24402.1 hypothetical protein BHU33_07325 [Fructilactobacillus lindneri DSM 20690 = JCM 11027]
MLFTRLFSMIWAYFDVLCFVLGAVCIVGFAFTFGFSWGILATGIALFFTGFLSELMASKGGEN